MAEETKKKKRRLVEKPELLEVKPEKVYEDIDLKNIKNKMKEEQHPRRSILRFALLSCFSLFSFF